MKITQDNQRLLDLVRYSRAELHEDGLISDKEYADLVEVGSISARRLEDYDDFRAKIKFLEKVIDDYKKDCAELNSHAAKLEKSIWESGTQIQGLKQNIIDLLKFVDFAIYDKKVDPGFFNIGIEKARERVKKS